MKKSTLPYLALLLCNSIWAMNYPIYKLIMPLYITPLAMVTATIIVAAVISLISLFCSKSEKVDKRDIVKIAIGAVLIGILRKVFLMEGMSLTSPIDGSIINSIGPILVLIISVMLHIDRFTPMKIVGIILGVSGAAMIVALSSSAAHHASDMKGNILIVMCALSSAFYMVWFKELVQKYSPLTMLRCVYCIAAIVIIPFGTDSLIHTDFAAMPTSAVLSFLFIVLLPTFGPNLLLMYGLKYVSPTITSIFTYVQPILATALAIAMGLDKLHWDTALAAIIIFVGIFFVIRSYDTNSTAPTINHH